MSFLSDLRAVSTSMVEQVAARFPDLPQPLLAAIGAGDMAVERLAELRDALQHSAPESGELRELAADLPGRAQRAVADVTSSLEKFAAEAPARAQRLISELPGRAQEVSQSLAPETVRQTVEAYTQLAGIIYGNLAKRGSRTWTEARSAGLVPGTVVPAATPPAEKAAPPAEAAASGRTATVKPAATVPTAKPAPTQPAAKGAPRAPRASTRTTPKSGA